MPNCWRRLIISLSVGRREIGEGFKNEINFWSSTITGLLGLAVVAAIQDANFPLAHPIRI